MAVNNTAEFPWALGEESRGRVPWASSQACRPVGWLLCSPLCTPQLFPVGRRELTAWAASGGPSLSSLQGSADAEPEKGHRAGQSEAPASVPSFLVGPVGHLAAVLGGTLFTQHSLGVLFRAPSPGPRRRGDGKITPLSPARARPRPCGSPATRRAVGHSPHCPLNCPAQPLPPSVVPSLVLTGGGTHCHRGTGGHS